MTYEYIPHQMSLKIYVLKEVHFLYFLEDFYIFVQMLMVLLR